MKNKKIITITDLPAPLSGVITPEAGSVFVPGITARKKLWGKKNRKTK